MEHDCEASGGRVIMSSYFSFPYLALFLPALMLVYNLVPQKHRWKILLGASYLFFWSISGSLLVYLLFSTMSIHHLGLWLNALQEERDALLGQAEKGERKQMKALYIKKQRKVVLFGVILHIGILLVIKYSGFFGTNINSLLSVLNIPWQLPIPKFLQPIGISFYTLQAVSYILDVYRGTNKADKNIGRLALFMAFFPQIMEGPICRYSQTAHQLFLGGKITYHNMTMGLQRIMYGLLKKMVIADRLNLFIMTVFREYAQMNGGVIAIAMFCYTIQLYMDFSGTMDVVIGSSEIFGITIPENFKQPFFSKTISEFWTRWHITLGTWFKEYIFYPVSMSKPMKNITSKARKRIGNHFGPLIAGSIALFCVWICNGLWHGSGWQFIFFGMYHFVFILCGNIVEPYVKVVTTKLHLNRQSTPYKGYQILRTFLLVNIGELFFRSESLEAGLTMFKTMVTNFSLDSIKSGSLFKMGMDKYDYLIVGITLILILIVSILKERGVTIRKEIGKKNIVVRWVCFYAVLFFIIIFGAYGSGYYPVEPMYASF